MRRLILLMTAMAAAMLLVVRGVAYALSVQCDGTGDYTYLRSYLSSSVSYSRRQTRE